MNIFKCKLDFGKEISINLDSKDELRLEQILIHENRKERKQKQKYKDRRHNAYVRNDLE